MTDVTTGTIRSLTGKVLRALLATGRATCSRCRCTLIRWMYPGCRLGRGVVIGAGTRIGATDGGRIEIGDHTVISRGVTIIAREGTIQIGAHTFIGQFSTISANRSVSIGEHGLVAECVTIRDQNHSTKLDAGPFAEQPLESRPIRIGNNVWIGAKATVLAGVTIGTDSVLAANAVATRDIASRTIAGGIPAARIRDLNRTDDDSD